MHHQRADDPRFTYGDYVQWQGDERWELIDGRATLMSPAPTRRHQEVLGELYRQIANQLEGHACNVFIAPFDVRLPANNEQDAAIDTVVQPDLTIICDPSKLDDAGARGAPDWVIEILSPSTTARDRVEKRDLYERVGVTEYWVVHPEDQAVIVLDLDDGRYTVRHDGPATGAMPPRAVDEVTVDWSRVFRG